MSELYTLIHDHASQILNRLKESTVKKIYNLSIPHFAMILQFLGKPFIAIEDSPEKAFRLYKDLLFFMDVISAGNRKPAFYFPPPDSPKNIGMRCKALYELSLGNPCAFITCPDALMTGFEIPSLKDRVLRLKKGLSFERSRLDQIFNALGYKEASLVVEKGDYARRGWIFDIFPVTDEDPIRVEFFGDEIELIKIFDIESQRSMRELEETLIFPSFEGAPVANLICELMKFDEVEIFCESNVCEEAFAQTGLQNYDHISISHLPFISDGIDSGESSLKGLGITNEERKSIEEIVRPISETERVVIALPSESQSQRLKDIFRDGGIIIPAIERTALLRYDGSKCITIGNLSSGINISGLLLLTDKEIFGERPDRPLRKLRTTNLLSQIEHLDLGDFVVHAEHGIGKFAGFEVKSIEDYEEELIIIDYANGDRLYTPTYNIDKIKKYSASEGHVPALSRLGSKRWQKTRQRVKEGIREMTEKLLRLYAERKVSKGFVFSDDTPMHREFDEFFPYEATDDQLRSFGKIKRLMSSETPMDMLLCGDVGFGKTEVAMRAAFRAVYDGKQVAVIVPTTLLAEQHYRTFKARFSAFPVKIDYLSRFKTVREVKKCLTALSRGEIDIIIGTHMLLKKDIRLSNLGLLIIDEEHRFGVSQKERLKELRMGVDVLTLTATPIPRTLHLSLSGIREMSTIETPPEERLAVRTFVTTFSDKTIKEAIEREVRRGGQVFFVHNRIRDINKMADFLKRLNPDIRIDVAHGRMRETDLEGKMLRFLDKQTDVLVCTAIIGSGLDITNANTLIVSRSDAFGLSDLYQLRGRVGRGSIQAYAYFLIPNEEIISQEAKKRLKALQEMSYLGAGLRLALKDLEIRGAGNMLGREQSGHIHNVGFDMYMEMLEKTVAELKGEVLTYDFEPQIRFRFTALIPEDYMPDITLRLSIYRRISSAKSSEELLDLKREMSDRFGTLPNETANLLNIMKIKLLAKSLYINKVIDTGEKIRFLFIIDPENVYKIPADFFDSILKKLFAFTSGKKAKNILFHPEGFELITARMQPDEIIKFSEEVLTKLLKN
jgi:transcription-repair coupling factor (superfamily II helicase)